MFAYANINGVARYQDSRSPSDIPYHCHMQRKQYKTPRHKKYLTKIPRKYHILENVPVPPCSILLNDMPNPTHHQTNKSQFADDAGQWAVSKNIDLAAEYLQRDLGKLARWCAKCRIKLNPEKTKVIIFSKSRSAIRAEPALSLYGDLLSYYPHIKFLGITFDNRMTFTKHFEEILERCTKNFIV